MPAKKGPHKGTGGHGRRKLEGKGPTPKAAERPGHPAQRRAKAAAKRAATGAARGEPRSGDRSRSGGRGRGGSPDDLVTGRNAVLEALRAAVPSVELVLAHGLDRDDRLDEIRKLAASRELDIAEVPRGELDRIAGEAPHQGVALRVQPFSYLHADDVIRRALDAPQPGLLVALDGVSDPHNLGAIARSAAAFGAHGLLLPERRAAGVTPAAWKSSAGALAHLPVARVTNLTRTLRAAADAGLMLAGLDGRGELDLDDLELAAGPLVLVVGAEGKGLSRLVAETCDVRVSIALPGAVESLNAAVAAGVALAAVARRRRSG
jgi:23S rRNA (guanosine2251-2'-O)-methyltransferase